ncbi:MliC family protein [uncultured Oceanisphaera sp.]|uniref:MliC family protein n=1 Tax=uncultured Oceanisphaera sp. TaxID=353858 RepID=UPI0026085408|nr:MliC family protein [uncultured Oceanisphaera sp.]
MSKWLAMCLMVASIGVQAGNGKQQGAQAEALCSESWSQAIEQTVATGDGQGHGPDVGSDEWKSVIEFKLGIRGQPQVPPRNSAAWCQYIDRQVRGSDSVYSGNGVTHGTAHGSTEHQGPSFACNQIKAGSIEAMVCEDEALSALDRTLAGVYAAALNKASNEHPPMLKAEQRGWIKGRNDCWKSDDKRACIERAYQRRIAELQASYRLVPHKGPFRFVCDGNPANEVITTFFETEPPTLMAERGDSVSLMFLQPSASGAKYQGRNESFWEHQGEARITWGYQAPVMDCQRAP